MDAAPVGGFFADDGAKRRFATGGADGRGAGAANMASMGSSIMGIWSDSEGDVSSAVSASSPAETSAAKFASDSALVESTACSGKPCKATLESTESVASPFSLPPVGK
ncbi:unnamed protein product [Chondrus crispus]|uniref:Uncharacterized protein n=1 Tax=Chondrus crispus TaxID=2769 RepID=R7Q7D0_CHOCR|nr:unnamed protein product [Chondrus crispus]CDF33291.1 unnamed protein product [Chondrus crispus]|eukprot:XP_005713094.1 unnamed protein product [Chondrus crispus]